MLALGATVEWREYLITTHDLPGHTFFAAAFEFEVDGVRVLATGDQQTTGGRLDGRPEILNYQYRNRFRRDDYVKSAELYRLVAPDLIVTGHWNGQEVDDDYLELLARQGAELAELHVDLMLAGEIASNDDGNIVLL